MSLRGAASSSSKRISARSPRNVSTAAGLGTSARCRQLSSRLGLDGSRPPGRPTPAHCHGTPDFICRIRVLDRVQRSPNGRYEAGKRRSTVDGGPDPRCSFCRPGKDAVKTCGHAASSRDKGTMMARPENPNAVAQAVPFDADQARRPGPGPCGSEGSPNIGISLRQAAACAMIRRAGRT